MSSLNLLNVSDISICCFRFDYIEYVYSLLVYPFSFFFPPHSISAWLWATFEISINCHDFPTAGVLCYSRSHQRRLELFGACWQSSVSRQLKRPRPGTRDEDCTVMALLLFAPALFESASRYLPTSVYFCFESDSITLIMFFFVAVYE